MTDQAVIVEHVSKRFSVPASAQPQLDLRDTIAGAVAGPFRRLKRLLNGSAESGDRQPNASYLALDDISFEVKRGAVIGIIGRNGAGKSTLLKVLSRITPPSTGRVTIRGRVGSLLEVGTGFHPELTGRENIILNGAILGMKRAEIDRKFDEIVAFAEVDQFIDTPVKWYSSGMYLRLAFSVAAHLEPEILIVDEVLAVGDAQFQKKCLGKMGEVSNAGRTVLFVSHNMGAVTMLCHSALVLSKGRVVEYGPTGVAVQKYLRGDGALGGSSGQSGSCELQAKKEEVFVRSLALRSAGLSGRTEFGSRELLQVSIDFDLDTIRTDLTIGFDIRDSEGRVVFRTQHTDVPEQHWPPLSIGRNVLVCDLPSGLLNSGRYDICLRVSHHCKEWLHFVDGVLQFDVYLDHGESPYWAVLDRSNRPGSIAPILNWSADTSHKASSITELQSAS